MDSPTHTLGNLLDLVITPDADLVSGVAVNATKDYPIRTDHMVTFELHLSSEPTRCRVPVVTFNYPKADWEGLSNNLLDVDWSFCRELGDVESIWAFKIAIVSAMDRFIPKVMLKLSQMLAWYTTHLRHRCKCLRTLTRSCAGSPSSARL